MLDKYPTNVIYHFSLQNWSNNKHNKLPTLPMNTKTILIKLTQALTSALFNFSNINQIPSVTTPTHLTIYKCGLAGVPRPKRAHCRSLRRQIAVSTPVCPAPYWRLLIGRSRCGNCSNYLHISFAILLWRSILKRTNM